MCLGGKKTFMRGLNVPIIYSVQLSTIKSCRRMKRLNFPVSTFTVRVEKVKRDNLSFPGRRNFVFIVLCINPKLDMVNS